MQALNGTTPRPASETVSRKHLTKMLAQVGIWSGVQALPCCLQVNASSFQPLFLPAVCLLSVHCCFVLPVSCTTRSIYWLNLVDGQLPRAQLACSETECVYT